MLSKKARFEETVLAAVKLDNRIKDDNGSWKLRRNILGRRKEVYIVRQEYWSGLRFPSSGVLSDPGIEPLSPSLQADSLLSEPPGKPCLIQAVDV